MDSVSSKFCFSFIFIPQPAEYRAKEYSLDFVVTLGLVWDLTGRNWSLRGVVSLAEWSAMVSSDIPQYGLNP